jgi:DNA mismatch endonuclease (patch repair protein)
MGCIFIGISVGVAELVCPFRILRGSQAADDEPCAMDALPKVRFASDSPLEEAAAVPRRAASASGRPQWPVWRPVGQCAKFRTPSPPDAARRISHMPSLDKATIFYMLCEMDTVTPATRSRMMAAVRSKNTKPELAVRTLVHELGFRFRLHRTDLPGTPDLVFPRLRCVLFVHGCFWHRHPSCPATTTPKDNAEYWATKFKRNVERDRSAAKELRTMGWHVLVIWQCQTRDGPRLRQKLKRFLDRQSAKAAGSKRDARTGRRAIPVNQTGVDIARTASINAQNTRAQSPLTSTQHSRLSSRDDNMRFEDPTYASS